MKDNFSIESDNYAKYRPTYPAIFFDYLNSIVPSKQNAWDCGTGNGQVAYELAKTFACVFATDISQSQISHALQADNINYSVQPAEATNFEKNQFDLIVIAQAIHWFDYERFFEEVRRTAKRGGIICAVGYGRIEVSKQIDQRIKHFYQEIIGAYWDKERKYIDEHYNTIPFPFNEIQAPRFVNKLQWTREHLLGYLNMWSAVRHYIRQNGHNPVNQFEHELDGYWDNRQTKEVRFPLMLRIGQLADF